MYPLPSPICVSGSSPVAPSEYFHLMRVLSSVKISVAKAVTSVGTVILVVKPQTSPFTIPLEFLMLICQKYWVFESTFSTT